MNREMVLKPLLGLVTAVTLLLGGCGADGASAQVRLKGERRQQVGSIHDFVVQSIDGKDVALADFKGSVLLIVNVASKCGFTGQYEGLQELYEKYKDQGFAVLGFPANDFLGQEPGTNDEIREFCTLNYGVTFPMFAKIVVTGKDQHPLYAFLTGRESSHHYGGRITWNFNKFLVDADGHIVNRFGTRVKPTSTKLTDAIEQALGGTDSRAPRSGTP